MNALHAADRAMVRVVERWVWTIRGALGIGHPLLLAGWRIAVITLSLASIALTYLEDPTGALITLAAAGIFLAGIMRELSVTWSDCFEPWTPGLSEKYARRSHFQRKAFPLLRLCCVALTALATIALASTPAAPAAPTLAMFWLLSIGGYVECSRPEIPDAAAPAPART